MKRSINWFVVLFVLLVGTSVFACPRRHRFRPPNNPPPTAPAPEPGTLLALGASAVGVGIARKIRKRRKQG